MHKATKKNQKSGKEDETIYYTPEQLGLKSEYDE